MMIALPLWILVGLALVAGLVVLLSHPHTRLATLAMLGIGALVVAVGGVFLLTARGGMDQSRVVTVRPPTSRSLPESDPLWDDDQASPEDHVPPRYVQEERAARGSVAEGQSPSDQAVLVGPLVMAAAVCALVVLLLNHRTRLIGFVMMGCLLLLIPVGLLLTHRSSRRAPDRSFTAEPGPARPPEVARGPLVAQEAVPRVPPPKKEPDSVLEALRSAVVQSLAGDEARPSRPAAEAELPVAPPATKRPAWVNDRSGPQGDLYRLVIHLEPHLNRLECQGRIPDALSKALAGYAADALHITTAEVLPTALPVEEFRPRIVRDEYIEYVRSSIGSQIPLQRPDEGEQDYPGWNAQVHLLVELDAATQKKIKDCVLNRWRQETIARRLWYAGGGLAAVLGLLAAAFAYLKIEPDRRAAARRLWLAAGLGILVAVAVGVVALLE